MSNKLVKNEKKSTRRGGCVTGLMMAWGMFCTIPVPSKRWDEKARPWMVFFLPIIGILVGGFWGLVMFLIQKYVSPELLANTSTKLLFAAVLTVAPFLITGFMHLDGFMDCCDAVLSHRDLEGRQKILKDSHVGSFAVICFVFLALFEFTCFAGMSFENYKVLTLVPVVSRCISAIAISICKPMSTSQYAPMREEGSTEKNSGGAKGKIINVRANIIACLFALLIMVVMLGTMLSVSALTVVFTEAFASLLIVLILKKNLGGMNGDISGCAIIFGEAVALLMMCILMS